jgi:hypothetical protein
MMKITRDVIESYMACHYKAFLKLTGHEGAIPHHRSSLPSENCGFHLTPTSPLWTSFRRETRGSPVLSHTSTELWC